MKDKTKTEGVIAIGPRAFAKTANRSDSDLSSTATKFEASALRAEARGHLGRAALYRRRAEELRAQLSSNAKAWFEMWSTKAERALIKAAECEAAGDPQGRAYGLRRDAQSYRFTACRFNAQEEAYQQRRRRSRLTLKLSQHALDVIEEIGISPRSNGSLSIILEEAIYAFEEMKKDAAWFAHLRFYGTARQQDEPRARQRADRAVSDAGEIQYQLARAEFCGE